jgi:5-methylcytosine-specific restriction endonuclease McrA
MSKTIRKKIKPIERLYLFEMHNYVCVLCNLKFIPPNGYNGKNTITNGDRWLEIDHINPISLGGSDSLNNKQILCNVCNSKKGNKV